MLFRLTYLILGAVAAMSAATDQGQRLIYAEAATAQRISDSGTATLKDGVALVALDPLFAQMVAFEQGYQVFLTPVSFDTPGLAVGNQTGRGFEVREFGRGKGIFQFHWRVEALRKGAEKGRLAPAPEVPALDVVADSALVKR